MESTYPILISIPVSPWSERAKFALHVAGFKTTEEIKTAEPEDGNAEEKKKRIEVVDYVAMIHEPYLRYVLGVWNPFHKVTVPVLKLPDGTLFKDSIDIAKWAAKQSNGALVIPDDALLSKVNELTEAILANGRFRSLHRCVDEGAFDPETLPPPLRMLPDAVNRFSVKIVCRYLISKYSKPGQTYENSLENMRTDLRALKQMLDQAGGKFFDGKQFTIADIVAAGAMSFGTPLPFGRSRLGPNMGKCWVEPDLAEEFKDLIAWRDTFYVEKRGPMELGKL